MTFITASAPEPREVAALADRIRPLVADVPPAMAAAALSYELAAVLARERVPLALADQTIDTVCEVMKAQLRAFGGPGQEHP